MSSHRRIVFTLILISFLMLTVRRVSWAQEARADNQQIESDWEMLRKAEEDVELLTSKQFVRDKQTMTIRAEQQLKKILQIYPQTTLRYRVEDNLAQVQEILGLNNFQIAQFYFKREHGMKGAIGRLRQIIQKYERFSRMDEVLLLLGKAYLVEEQPEEAANSFWKLVCKYPTSKYTGEAFEQLNTIGFDASKGCDNLKP